MVDRSPPRRAVLATHGVVYGPAQRTVSLVFDIGTGAGLATATGVRPFLPPLLAGALARGDIGIDFDGSGWQFLESPAFLVAVLALAVAAYLAERAQIDRRTLQVGTAVVAGALGVMLFTGTMAAADEPEVIGLVGGGFCAMLALGVVGGLFERASKRLDDSAASLLVVYADAAALVLAAIAIFLPPVAFLALIALLVVAIRARRGGDEKYAGLRILR